MADEKGDAQERELQATDQGQAAPRPGDNDWPGTVNNVDPQGEPVDADERVEEGHPDHPYREGRPGHPVGQS